VRDDKNQSYSESYKKAGVDITKGYKAVELMKPHIRRTKIPGVMSDIGGFGGMFDLSRFGGENPVLVSGTDGVGTKLKLAFALGKHDTIGIDCVAMCVNDIICSGAKPLFFLDYLAAGNVVPEIAAEIVSGVAEGCVLAGCALLGGETAEMPGFYPDGEYDLAGFAVGVVEKQKIIENSSMAEGDIIIALPSSGVHSNGFSLVRRVFDFETGCLTAGLAEYDMSSLGEVLLTPTAIYVKPVAALIEKVKVKGLSNITGGGFYENLPRAIKSGLDAVVFRKKIKIPPIFGLIATSGDINDRDMFNTFNMGVGMAAVVSESDARSAICVLKANGVDAYEIGCLKKSESETPKVIITR